MTTRLAELRGDCPAHPGCVVVRVTEVGTEYAAHIAMLRQRGAAGRPNAGGLADLAEADAYARHCTGAFGEVAAAAVLYPASGGRMLTVNSWRAPDLPPDIEVRTRQAESYGLKVKPGEDPYRRFVLVQVHDYPVTHLRGWARGAEAMDDRWLLDPVRHHGHGRSSPAYFVPPGELRPMPALGGTGGYRGRQHDGEEAKPR